jgi:hypothetical protein
LTNGSREWHTLHCTSRCLPFALRPRCAPRRCCPLAFCPPARVPRLPSLVTAARTPVLSCFLSHRGAGRAFLAL